MLGFVSSGVPNDKLFRIEPSLAKMICERLQTDFLLIVNFRGKNLTALQSQLAITMTYVVASQHPSYLLYFSQPASIINVCFPSIFETTVFCQPGDFLKFSFVITFAGENIVTKKQPCSKRVFSYHQQQSAIHFTHLEMEEPDLSEEGPGLDACNTCLLAFSAPLLEKRRWIKLTCGHRWPQIIFPAFNVISFLL